MQEPHSSAQPEADGEQARQPGVGVLPSAPAGRRWIRTQAQTAEPVAETTPAPVRPSRRGRLLTTASVLLALGLLGAGVTAGFWLHERFASPPAPVLAAGAAAAETGEVAIEMVVLPDVTQLGRLDAEDALADAGVDLAIVTAKDVPWAGAPGIVVAQEPRRGSSDPASVALSVSVPTVVPAVAGTTLAQALDALEALGAEVVRRTVYKPGAEVGRALASDPAAGQPLPDQVTVTVAGEPAGVYLDALTATRGGCRTGSADIGGQSFDHALRCTSSSSEGRVTAFALIAGIDRFETSLVGRDDSDPVTVRVLLDGRVLATKTINSGSSQDLALLTTGGAELTFEAISPAGSSGQDWYLGDPILLGTVEATDRLAAGN